MRLFLFNIIHSAVGDDPIVQPQGYVLNEIFPVCENDVINFVAGFYRYDGVAVVLGDFDGGIGGV